MQSTLRNKIVIIVLSILCVILFIVSIIQWNKADNNLKLLESRKSLIETAKVNERAAIQEAFEQKERADKAETEAEVWKNKYEECLETK